ncbi:universal stress protein [Noviherbaspirillum sp.]|uniref:universal stress protein n=1 Tax=Noviherbaspirillum sp. TaxID=1926288 RepID=UPI002B472F24|nr:universal stress protein [Noviherbaspirillum sp.]HJV81983.1 universal stress protein [Noviherbaspirillum sp.]
MSIKTVAVHIDQSVRAIARLEIAVALCRKHNAYLIGLYTNTAAPAGNAPESKPMLRLIDQWKADFENRAAGLAGKEWRNFSHLEDPDAIEAVVTAARLADLVVVGQAEPGSKGRVLSSIPEIVILNAGRPVLVIPYAGDYRPDFASPIFAWKDTKEAAHALKDALHVIGDAKNARVISIEHSEDDADATGLRVVEHLARHGIQATHKTVVADEVGVMDMLLSSVSDLDGDVLVMGGHAQSGFLLHERGKGTRYVLEHMTVPVLMSS